jgi:transposase
VHLLPPSPEEWLPDGHLAFFVLDLVEDLDLGAIEAELQRKDPRGERPYSPRMMTALLLYGYAVGTFSSRRIERATYEDVAFRVLAAGEHPHFTTVNDFRNRHRQALAGLFGQVLKECQSAGLVKLGHVAIDGTKMKANASKHKAMSYERMLKDEARLTAEAEALLAKADAVDSAEDELYGVGQTPQDLPAELQRRDARKAKIRQVREALQREAAEARATQLREQAEDLRRKAQEPETATQKQSEFKTKAAQRDGEAKRLDGKDDDEPPPPAPPAPDDDLPLYRPRTTKEGTPHPKAQRNFTDPESKIMFRDGTFLQAFNAQAAVDEAHQIIVAAAMSNQPPDVEYFVPMLERIVDNCNGVPEAVTADAGYFSAANVRAAERMGAEPFISVGKHRNDGTAEEPKTAPHVHTALREAMREQLNSPRGKAIYARRKATVEPVFGQIRSCRGFRQFSFRGLFKNRCEWLFVCLTHNLLKLFRAAKAVEARRLAAA